MSVKNTTIDDMSRITTDIPDAVKIAIADVVIAFSRAEAACEELLWGIFGLTMDDGSMLTTMDARPKFSLAKTMIGKRRLNPKGGVLPPTFWESLDELRTHRNSVAHGQWVMMDLIHPAVASYRTKDQHGKRIMADAFSIDRLEAISRQCDRCAEYFRRLNDESRERRSRPSSRPPKK